MFDTKLALKKICGRNFHNIFWTFILFYKTLSINYFRFEDNSPLLQIGLSVGECACDMSTSLEDRQVRLFI